MGNGERPAIVGAPEEAEVGPQREGLARREGFGVWQETAMDEWERGWWGWEWVVQVLVVFFGDLETCHGGAWE